MADGLWPSAICHPLFADKMKLYGKNPVLERLKSNPQSIQKILIQQNHPEACYIRSKAKKWNIPIFFIPRDRMHRLGQNIHAQGIIMEVEQFAYVPFDEMLTAALCKNQSPVFIDELNDPQNLGGIIRSLGCLGNFSVVFPKHDSVSVTEAVLRVACGGENYVEISQVSNLGHAIWLAKEAGFWIAGTVVEGGKNLFETALPFPLALVMGSEQKGIREIIKKKLDLELTISVLPSRMSFNVAHAAAILAYEIAKQKKKSARTPQLP